MHWLIDAGAIKTGGGVQVALNRLPIFTQKLIEKGHEVSVLLPSEGMLAHIELESSIKILRSPNNWRARLLLEHLHLPKYMRKEQVDIIYTLFGFGLPHPRNVVSVVSTANPTTCYPESIYWKRLKYPEKIKRAFYTYLRQIRLKNSDFCIFETEVMQKRSIEHIGINEHRTAAINPSPTNFIQNRPARLYKNTNRLTITILTGIERHKNVDCVLRICQALSTDQNSPLQFQISLSRDQLNSIAPNDVNLEKITNLKYLGKIPQNELQPIYDQSDIIMNLSELESFSNNYMEAWKAGLAQICSDRDFARHICANSAAFIEPLNTEQAVQQIISATSNPDRLTQMANQGKLRLEALLPHEAYVEKTLHIIESFTRKMAAQ